MDGVDAPVGGGGSVGGGVFAGVVVVVLSALLRGVTALVDVTRVPDAAACVACSSADGMNTLDRGVGAAGAGAGDGDDVDDADADVDCAGAVPSVSGCVAALVGVGFTTLAVLPAAASGLLVTDVGDGVGA